MSREEASKMSISDQRNSTPERSLIVADLLKAQQKQKANKIKVALRTLFKKLDDNQTGMIGLDAFLLLLETHQVRLSQKAINKIKVQAAGNELNKDDKIKYLEALRIIQPNMELEEPLLKEWTVNQSNGNSEYQQSIISLNSQFSKTGYQTTNQQLRTLNQDYYPYGKSNVDVKIVDQAFQQPTQSVSPKITQTNIKRGRSPGVQPHQTSQVLNQNFATMSYNPASTYQQRQSQKDITWFDGQLKQDLLAKNGSNETSFKTVSYETTFSTKKPKQQHPSANLYKTSYNIITNNESDLQKAEQFEQHNSTSLSGVKLSERGKNSMKYKSQNHVTKAERPNIMRPSVVDSYIKSVLDLGANQINEEQAVKASGSDLVVPTSWVRIIEQIYRLNLDNRILNNLRQQLNELIEDEKGLVSPEVFKRMFFTFFKGERYAYQVFEMLLPVVSEHYDEDQGKYLEESDPRATDANKVVQIQKLTQFIDMFNFYPVKVNKLRYKNDSNELTYVMNSGKHGTKNDRGEVVISAKGDPKSEEERYLIKLLALVSDKIKERFVNLQQCFRFLDTNHSQSISINEFAQAMDHMRLKISFEDIKKLFNYIDKKGQGEIGYDEFTLLLEERWRGIDPVDMLKAQLANRKQTNPMQPQQKIQLHVYDDCPTQQEVFEKLEGLAKNRIKVPIRQESSNYISPKITRSDANNFLSQAQQMETVGKSTLQDSKMADVLNHSYLQRSIEQRVQRKALYNEYLTQLKTSGAMSAQKQTNASRLRSQTILDSIASSNKDSISSDKRSISVADSRCYQKEIKNKMYVLQKANKMLFDQATRTDYNSVKKVASGKQGSFTLSETKSQFPQLNDEIVRQSLQNLQLTYPEANTEQKAREIYGHQPRIQLMSKQEKDEALSEFYKGKKQMMAYKQQQSSSSKQKSHQTDLDFLQINKQI